eukprot:Hpha_TRINITY_DN16776_c4_g4::TRINITY_DN16776_c4_g4_i1::g.76503::m.76503
MSGISDIPNPERQLSSFVFRSVDGQSVILVLLFLYLLRGGRGGIRNRDPSLQPTEAIASLRERRDYQGLELPGIFSGYLTKGTRGAGNGVTGVSGCEWSLT